MRFVHTIYAGCPYMSDPFGAPNCTFKAFAVYPENTGLIRSSPGINATMTDHHTVDAMQAADFLLDVDAAHAITAELTQAFTPEAGPYDDYVTGPYPSCPCRRPGDVAHAPTGEECARAQKVSMPDASINWPGCQARHACQPCLDACSMHACSMHD